MRRASICFPTAVHVAKEARVVDGFGNAAQAFGTIDWVLNATTTRGGAQSMFRAVMPEGQLTLDNTTFDIGGLSQVSTFREFSHVRIVELSSRAVNRIG